MLIKQAQNIVFEWSRLKYVTNILYGNDLMENKHKAHLW